MNETEARIQALIGQAHIYSDDPEALSAWVESLDEEDRALLKSHSPAAQQEVMEWWERAQPALQAAAEAAVQMVQAFIDGFRPIVEAVQQWGATTHEAIWSDYRRAGMPYGETFYGLLRFHRESARLWREEARRQVERERRWYFTAPMRFQLRKRLQVGFQFSLN